MPPRWSGCRPLAAPARAATESRYALGGHQEHNLGPEALREAQAAHADAGRVLARLIRDRLLAEARMNETGRRDPLRQVTGASALDRAVVATQSIVDRLELLLLESAGASPDPVETSPPRAHRRPGRSGKAASLAGAART